MGVAMPKHEDMDFPHAPAWCDDCWGQEVQMRMLVEIRRANDLKERELLERLEPDRIEPKRIYRQPYILPPPKPTSTGKGGISLD